MSRRWYLVRTLGGRELVAAMQLERQGFRTFLPKQLKTVRHARKLRTSAAAFFPSYLFVELDLGRDRWRSINGTIGVSHLVSWGERPAAVPHGIVESLVRACGPDGMLAPPLLREGQTVRIIAGPFADRLAVIDRLDEAGRVRVLLEIMGCETPVETRTELLAEAS